MENSVMRLYGSLILFVSLLIIGGSAALLSATSHAQATSSPKTPTTDPPILTAWLINTNGHTNPHWASTPVDVQSVQQITVDGVPWAQVRTNGIADYYTTMTADLIQELNSRPRAATDFRNGQTTATIGQIVRFGDDIGYRTQSCFLGYWPPGPGCPSGQNRSFNFPMQPLMATQPASTTLGAIGLWVNGVAVYNWSDGQSYGNQRVWSNTALSFEVYDLDICPGHAAMGDYHNHSNPDCVARLLGDDGSAHSPIYGFAADGFAIYGPWESNGVLAESGWRTRDYDNPNSITGCGVARVRNCLLRNPLDPSQGTIPAPQTGPRTDAQLTTMSGNVITATSGVYYQDYWYDTSCTTCLDQHNGHDTGDGRGYHYHVTVRQPTTGSRLVPVFPYIVGPTYAGQLQPAATYTPTPVSTAFTSTPTFTPTAISTSTAIPTGTQTPTRTHTPTRTATPTTLPSTSTAVPSSSTPTSTQAVSTSTPASTSTQQPSTSTPIATATPVSQTLTPTSISLPVTSTSTPSPTPTYATATPTLCSISFSDVSPADYFYDGVRGLYCAGVVSGYADGTFRPYNYATRGQVAKIVVLAFGYAIYTPPQPTFSDVPAGSTFFQFVETAAHNGIVGGYGDGTFRPGNNITRGQLSKVVVLAAGWPLLNPPTPHFTDVPLTHTFYTYVETAFNHAILSGYGDGTFRPNANATRGQISKIVYGAEIGR